MGLKEHQMLFIPSSGNSVKCALRQATRAACLQDIYVGDVWGLKQLGCPESTHCGEEEPSNFKPYHSVALPRGCFPFCFQPQFSIYKYCVYRDGLWVMTAVHCRGLWVMTTVHSGA